MAVWRTIPQGFILLFIFVIYLSIMAMLKCYKECPQQYEATSLRALKIHQKHCEVAQRQHTRSMQTRKFGLAKDKKQWTALHGFQIARSNTNAAEVSIPPLLDPLVT